MTLAELIKAQIERDRRRGFSVDFTSHDETVSALFRDLVGAIGEVGEFSDLLKKVDLARRIPGYTGPSLEEARPHLGKELADITIYIFRIATILNCDLENELLMKMAINDDRYRHLEK